MVEINFDKDKVLAEVKKMKKNYKGFDYSYDNEFDILRLSVVGEEINDAINLGEPVFYIDYDNDNRYLETHYFKQAPDKWLNVLKETGNKRLINVLNRISSKLSKVDKIRHGRYSNNVLDTHFFIT